MAGMKVTESPVALGRLGIPTLVLRGDRDVYISAGETDSLSVMVSASRTNTYFETGHAPHWERPSEFARDVLAFRK